MNADAPEDDLDRLYHDATLVQFYDHANVWDDDQEYCRNLAETAGSILDLGCGTGLFLTGLPEDRERVGVDQAVAMLDVARARMGGDQATWIEGDARTVQLDRRFDLIVLTGHAFQVFLREDDQRRVLGTIRDHLNPGGRFIFDSRNPRCEAWRHWTPDDQWTFNHPDLGVIDAWNDSSRDETTGVVIYESYYRVVRTGEVFSAVSKIVFTPQEKIATLIVESGLQADQWLGDWKGADFTGTSQEIIPVGRLAE